MRNFFASVTRKGEHTANMAVQSYRDAKKDELDAEKRGELRNEIAERREKRIAENRKRRHEATKSLSDERTDEQKVQDEIDAVAEDIPDVPSAPKIHVKRHQRPANWEDIADDAEVYGNDAAIANFSSAFEGSSDTANYQRVNQWKKDLKAKKVFSTSHGPPSYGKEID